IGAVGIAEVVATFAGSLGGQGGNHVAGTTVMDLVLAATDAEVDADAVGQLTLETDQEVGVGAVDGLVTVTASREAVEVVRGQAIADARCALAVDVAGGLVAAHAEVDVLAGAVVDLHDARCRRVA